MLNSYTAVVSQAIDLLDGLSVGEYQKKLPPHFPSSIGTHMRHIVDHFQALVSGHQKGHVNYNVRKRYNDVEQFPEAAIAEFEGISAWLQNIDDADLDKVLLVSTDLGPTHSATSHSTLARELVFVSSHAIHHYALIRIMCAMQNKQTPEFFGYAPATIRYINRSA